MKKTKKERIEEYAGMLEEIRYEISDCKYDIDSSADRIKRTAIDFNTGNTFDASNMFYVLEDIESNHHELKELYKSEKRIMKYISNLKSKK